MSQNQAGLQSIVCQMNEENLIQNIFTLHRYRDFRVMGYFNLNHPVYVAEFHMLFRLVTMAAAVMQALRKL